MQSAMLWLVLLGLLCQALVVDGLFLNKKVARGASFVGKIRKRARLNVTQKPLEDQGVFDEQPKRDTLSLREVFTPKTLNSFGLFWTIAGDIFLLNLGFFLAFLSDIDLTAASTSFFDAGVFSDCLYISAFVSLGGFLFDKIPTKTVQEIVSDTRFYTLRLLGRNTSPPKAFAVSALLSMAAAFCEELFFRGFVLVGLMDGFGFSAILASFISSLLFGLSHSPRWGSSAVVETGLGLLFAFTFVMTGFNLAYPILVHFFYDLTTLFFTWLGASRDLRLRMKAATERQLINLNPSDSRLFDSLIRATFDLLDLDGDDAISPREMERGMKLFGIAKAHPFDRGQSSVLLINNPEMTDGEEELTVAELFRRCDKNDDGKLQYYEFRNLMSGGLFSWPDNDQWITEGTL